MLTSMIVALIESGDLAAAGTAGAAALAQCRGAGDLLNLPFMLAVMADLDMRAGHFQDAAAHLRDGLQNAVRAGDLWDVVANGLFFCALLCTAPPAAAGPGLRKLSARERELITLVAQGRTDAQIAAQLYISTRIVRSHLTGSGQARLLPPRRPDPPGPSRGPGLASARRLPAPAGSGRSARGSSGPSATGVSRPLPGVCPGTRTCLNIVHLLCWYHSER